MKPTVRSPRSIAEEKNDPAKFQGDAGYNPVAGVPNGIADGTPGDESKYRANPVNPPVPPAPFAQKKA